MSIDLIHGFPDKGRIRHNSEFNSDRGIKYYKSRLSPSGLFRSKIAVTVHESNGESKKVFLNKKSALNYLSRHRCIGLKGDQEIRNKLEELFKEWLPKKTGLTENPLHEPAFPKTGKNPLNPDNTQESHSDSE